MYLTLYRFILPILAEYADAGYREPKSRLIYSLRSNAQYQAIVLGAGILGLIYFFITQGASPTSFKALIMALAYCWGLMLAIYLMGHGLVAIPRRLYRSASISGKLKRIQGNAPKVHEKMEDAIHNLEDLEAQVAALAQRKTGSAKEFRDWIEELADESHLPESQPRTLTRRMSTPEITVPNVITERYLADLSRKLTRARHSRSRYLDEWDRLLQDAADTQAVLDSAASRRIEIGQASPDSSLWEKITLFTPYTRYLYKYYFVPYFRMFARMQAHWKLSRAWGLANLMVVHRLSTTPSATSDRSPEGLPKGILGDTATRILYNEPFDEAQAAGKVLGLTSVEIAQLPDLARGEGLWRVNERAFVVRHLCTGDELALFDTDARMVNNVTDNLPSRAVCAGSSLLPGTG